jgi:uncharacterized protein (DUF433 family)
MTLVISSDPIPLTVDQDGVTRVAGTRVTLDTIVAAFEQGTSVESIAEQYPSVSLADVCAVVGFYLRHREHVATYLEERCRQATAVRQENERRFPPDGVRDRLSERRSASG